MFTAEALRRRDAETQRRRENINSIFCRKNREERKEKFIMDVTMRIFAAKNYFSLRLCGSY